MCVGVCVCVCVCLYIYTYIQEGWTAFILAAIRGHLEVVELLLDKGANVNQADKVSVPVRVFVRACVRACLFEV